MGIANAGRRGLLVYVFIGKLVMVWRGTDLKCASNISAAWMFLVFSCLFVRDVVKRGSSPRRGLPGGCGLRHGFFRGVIK